MKAKRALLIMLLVVSLPVGWVLAANGSGFEISRFVIGSGGGRLTSGSYALEGTVGQAVTDKVDLGSYALCSGFWCGSIYRLYLPSVLR